MQLQWQVTVGSRQSAESSGQWQVTVGSGQKAESRKQSAVAAAAAAAVESLRLPNAKRETIE